MVIFHHIVSVAGLSHGVRFDGGKHLVASYGLIEFHTTFMTYRRFTGKNRTKRESKKECIGPLRAA